MPKVIDAIFENGVFKPLEKIDLKEPGAAFGRNQNMNFSLL